MSKMLAVLAAIFMLWIVALPGPASAEEWGAKNPDQYELRVERRCVSMPRYSYRSYCYYYRPDYVRPYHNGYYYYRPYGPDPLFPFF